MADPAQRRPERSQRYPWYDSVWLAKYDKAKRILRTVKPAALASFVERLHVFQTRRDFGVTPIERPFEDAVLSDIRRVAKSLHPADLELHEVRTFGRFIVHDHPFFTGLQRRLVPLVSEAAGEAVEPAYNFLSLYTAAGVCPPHLDSPQAKWTLDLCLDQSGPWPIHLSDVQPWPDSEAPEWRDENWEENLKQSASLNFASHMLHPGQAIVFSGSSQWHYRDAIPATGGRPFCDLLFLHFIPTGTAELVLPENWARLFGVPELGQLAEGATSSRSGS